MSLLTAIARATSMMVLGATSLFGQVDRRFTISRPIIPTTTPEATLERPLPAPTNLTLTPAGTSASLRWDPVPGATSYLVTRTSALYGTIQQTPTPISSTSFTDVSQQFDPRYLHTYRVSAVYPMVAQAHRRSRTCRRRRASAHRSGAAIATSARPVGPRPGWGCRKRRGMSFATRCG